jgi:hypothetical protein
MRSNDLPQTYRLLSDDDIADLHAQADQLTDEARRALAAEIERRGLSGQRLQKLHRVELRGEAKFDRREKWRRKSLASWLLFRGDPKGTLLTFLAFVVLILLSELFRLFRGAHH